MRIQKQLDTLPLYQLSLVFGLLAVLPYLGALQAEFVFDDHNAVLRNVMVTGDFDLVAIFQRDFWGKQAFESIGSYRPLAVLSFCLDQQIGGGSPWAYHLSNLLLHGATCAALYYYAARRFGRTLAALAASLFAVHALHTENLAAIVARADVLATLLVIVTLHLARKGASRSWLCGLTFLAALLAKEIAIAAIAILLADLVLGLDPDSEAKRNSRLVSLASMLLALGAYFFLRYAAMGIIEAPVLIQGNPLLDASFAERIYTCAALVTRSFQLLLFPLNLVADYSIPAIMPEPSLLDLSVIAGLVLSVALVAAMFFLRKRKPAIAWGAAVMLAAYVPVSNLFVLVPTIYAERLLYLPSVGFCVVLAQVLAPYFKSARFGKGLAIFFGIYLAFHFVRSAARTTDWQSERDIFAAAVETEPVSLLSRVQLGAAERGAGNLEAAAYQYDQAIRLAPNFGNPYTELGITLDLMGAPERAHPLLLQAVRITPNCPECVVGLVSFYLKYGRFEAAQAAIDSLQRHAPDARDTVIELRAKLEEIRALEHGQR